MHVLRRGSHEWPCRRRTRVLLRKIWVIDLDMQIVITPKFVPYPLKDVTTVNRADQRLTASVMHRLGGGRLETQGKTYLEGETGFF